MIDRINNHLTNLVSLQLSSSSHLLLVTYGPVWYHPKGIANIIGMSNVADNDKYWIWYDSKESNGFIPTRTKDGKENCFHRAPHGLHRQDTKATKNGEDGEVLINNVEDNKSSYTRKY